MRRLSEVQEETLIIALLDENAVAHGTRPTIAALTERGLVEWKRLGAVLTTAGRAEAMRLSETLHTFDGPCVCGFVHRVNPDPVVRSTGQFKCCVCRTTHDDAALARACAVSDHERRLNQ